jgi:hypothetical protein
LSAEPDTVRRLQGQSDPFNVLEAERVDDPSNSQSPQLGNHGDDEALVAPTALRAGIPANKLMTYDAAGAGPGRGCVRRRPRSAAARVLRLDGAQVQAESSS